MKLFDMAYLISHTFLCKETRQHPSSRKNLKGRPTNVPEAPTRRNNNNYLEKIYSHLSSSTQRGAFVQAFSLSELGLAVSGSLPHFSSTLPMLRFHGHVILSILHDRYHSRLTSVHSCALTDCSKILGIPSIYNLRSCRQYRYLR